ncbi:MAG: MFS transporter, partial [Candidatus Omnitrophica bacterium]|nr:MFS transporter [Candidatus Omnitrophota bacterium]
FLRWTTYGCVTATLLLGVTPHLLTALVLFGIANFCYQLGTIFYDALLWRVAPPGRLGQTSGIGAAFGYAGSMIGLLLLWPFVRWGGYQASFAPSALCFLLFALPSFLMIREARGPRPSSWRELMRTAWLRLGITVRFARRHRGLWGFLWASFFSSNAINTVLVFMAVYTRKIIGFTNTQLMTFFLFSQAFAIAGAIVFGKAVGRWGAKRTLAVVWCGWIAALGLLVADVSERLLWVAGPITGFCLGSTWATARVLLMELSPKDQLAEMFGLAGLFGRASSILGPLLWGLLVWDPARYPVALLSLIGLLVIGLWILSRVPEPPVSVTT